MNLYEQPLRVAGERVWRVWPGGRELDRLHGAPEPRDGSFPEEWMVSATRATNVGREDIEEGLCRLVDAPGNPTLKETLAGHPAEMLGAAHAARFGATTGILVKLLDAQARLQLQAHPDKATARRVFGSEYGKTECWHFLKLRDDGPTEPCIHLGFKPGATRERWRDCFERQDSEGMLAMMHRFVPKRGDTFLVPGGWPHAIGGGCFLIEIQEPTDLTVRTERTMPYGVSLPDAALHQGAGFERMFDVFDYTGRTEEEALAACRLPLRAAGAGEGYRIESLVDYDATECFRMERLTLSGSMPFARDGVFCGLYVERGAGRIVMPGAVIPLAVNDQFFVPAACGPFSVERSGGEELRMVRFFGPKTR